MKTWGICTRRAGKTLQCSFSSVSTPPIARVGAFFSIFAIYKIFTPSHLWNPKWKTTWRKTSRKIPKKTKELDPMEKSKRKKLQGKHGTRQKRCGVRRQRNGQRRKTFSCICVYFHVFAIRSMQFLRILNIFMHFETFSCNTKMDERSQRRACKHFHANSKMTQGHTPE